MTTIFRILTMSLLILIYAGTVLAERKKFDDSTTVVVVEVPVNVLRGGEPVRGLTAEDFEVLDRGKPRPLVGFDVIDLEAVGPEAAQKVPQVAQRHFLLLFDLAFSRTKTLGRAIEGGRELLAGLHPADRIAVALFGLSGGTRTLLNFTSDHSQVENVLGVLETLLDRESAVDQVEGGRPASDPLRLVASDPRAIAAEIGRAAGIQYSFPGQILREAIFLGGGGRAPDLYAETIADMDDMVSKELRERRRGEVINLAESFGALADLTRGIEGRKYLVYFSEGFENYLLEEQGSAMFLKLLSRMFEEFRRTGWTIQSVDPGGLRDLTEDFQTANGMVLFARETGGEFFQHFNHLGDAMDTLLEKTGVTYLLAFQSPEIAQDGSFRPIKVKLKGSRGAKLRHRSGYYAPDPREMHSQEMHSQARRDFSTAEMILSGEEGGELDLAVLATPFRSPYGDGSEVTVWIEAAGADVLEDFAGGPVTTELYVYALDETGEVRDFLTRRIELDPARIEQRLAKGGHLKFYGDLHLTPGEYDLRVLVRTTPSEQFPVTGGRHGLRRVPISVGDSVTAGPMLFEPVFFDDPGRPSIVVREKVPEGVSWYPFRIGEGRYFPAVRRTLESGQPARISLMAYELGEGLRLKAFVKRGDGTPVGSERIAVAGKDTHEGLDQIFFDFRPDGLEPGDYTFEVALSDSRGETTYTSSMAFQLTE